MDATRYGVATHTAKLDVDDFAGPQLDGGTRLLFRMNAFVEANRRVEFFLEFNMAVNVIPTERLLDHHEIKPFELLQQRPIT